MWDENQYLCFHQKEQQNIVIVRHYLRFFSTITTSKIGLNAFIFSFVLQDEHLSIMHFITNQI